MNKSEYKAKLSQFFYFENNKIHNEFDEVHMITVQNKQYLVGVNRNFDEAYDDLREEFAYHADPHSYNTPHKSSYSRSFIAPLGDDGNFTGDSFLIEATSHDNHYETPRFMDAEHLERYFRPAHTDILIKHHVLSKGTNEYKTTIDAYYNVADREQLKVAVNTLEGSSDTKQPTNNDVVKLITEQLIKPSSQDQAFRKEEYAQSLPAGKTAVLRAAVMAKGGSKRKSSFIGKALHKRKIAKVVKNFYSNNR